MTPPSSPSSPAGRKARGAFFTPPAVAEWMVSWAVRDAADRVLEPSAGEAAFLLPAVSRLRERGATRPTVTAVEIDADSAAAAAGAVRAAGGEVDLRVGDFFGHAPDPAFDAVVGNPPYVRYQGFTGAARRRAQEAALRAGVPLSNLASSWAAFTVHAALFLKPGGRLALVLPAELLSVNYAAGVRDFLMRRFARVRLVLFTERVFPGVQEEVVLLLADGVGPTEHCDLLQVSGPAHLQRLHLVDGPDWSRWTPTAGERWTTSLLSPAVADTYARLLARDDVHVLHSWGETTLGGVTGANRFFALSPGQVADLGLAPRDLVPLSPPGSRHLDRLDLTAGEWCRLGDEGARTRLFRPGTARLDAAARAYVRLGEADGVDQAYKCRVRSPWWRVPLPPPADVLLTYMNAGSPRLVTNSARVHHLNSVHGVYLHPENRDLADVLPVAALSSLTAVGAEVVGRAYGGGMLKVEPREADRLPLPTPVVVRAAADRLREVLPRAADLVSRRRRPEAVQLVDEVLLQQVMGVPGPDVAVLRTAAAALRARRSARAAPVRSG